VRRATRIATFASAIALLVGAAALGTSNTASQSGPTPYPVRPEDWPGEGVVRVFGWMKDNRNFFWSEREKKQGSIVFAGDSLTGNWKTLSKDWGKDFPGVLVANRGIGGDVSRGLLFRFQEDVLALHPRAIVILIGINDLTARQPATATLANLRSILEMKRTQQPDVPVVLCTVPPSANPKAPIDERQRRFLNQGLRQLAKENQHVSLVDLYAATVTADGTPDLRYFQQDQLHFSAAGHERWKEVLQPALQKAGVL
jgi:lysophospholipase L1-like esterase